MKKKLFSGALILLFVFAISGVSLASVSPPSVDEALEVGETLIIDKLVETPEIPPKIDVIFNFDLSGSFNNDLPNIKSIAGDLFDQIRSQAPDSRFAIASFVDYPIPQWGYPSYGDYAFNLNLDFTYDKLTWVNVINGLNTRSGGDFKESQLTSVKRSAEEASWGDDRTKVAVLITDAAFHLDSDVNFYTGELYPGPSFEDTIEVLNEKGITVVGIKAPGPNPTYDEMITADMERITSETGGTVVDIDSSSTNIAEAILEGLGNLPIPVIPHVIGCGPLSVTLSPSSQIVTSGDIASFTETITVPNNDSLQGTSVSCEVLFTDEHGTELGVQTINVDILDTMAPVVECIPSHNPSGKNIPKAGEKGPAINPDGFYLISAFDNVDEELGLYINGFGPYASGDTIKITEAPGVTPEEKTMGKDKMIHLILDTDAVLTVTDSADNEVVTTCYVPPSPK